METVIQLFGRKPTFLQPDILSTATLIAENVNLSNLTVHFGVNPPE